MKNNYCPLAFHGIYIERSADGKSRVAPCCLADKSQPISESIDFNSNDHLSRIRQAFIDDKKPYQCNPCWELENKGGKSRRKIYIDKFKNVGLYQTSNLYYLDYNTLPICNARCIICSPQYSSTWASFVGINEISNIVKNNYDHLSGLHLNDIKSIYFNGGEPLLTDEHTEVLKKINDLSLVDISYNTNGSCYPNIKTLDLWNQAKSVTVFFSIDGIKEKFEKTRIPLKWDLVSSNIKRINLLDNINIGCSYTIGVHNVFDLEDTINWFNKLPNFNSMKQFHVHYVNPEHRLYFKSATSDEKEKFYKEILKFDNYHWYTSIVNAIKNDK